MSADPPTILVCLHGSSRIASCVRENGSFAVNVLPSDAAKIADRFAGSHDETVRDRFDGLCINEGQPHIDGATHLVCELVNAIAANTHLICVGRVTSIKIRTASPLTYLAGKYGKICESEILV